MNLIDTEAQPEAGHRFDVRVGREHPRAGRTHRGDGVSPRLIRCHVRPATERLQIILLHDLQIVVAFALVTRTAHRKINETHRVLLGFRHGDGHLGNFILGNDGITMIDYEQAARNASCARDGCADQIFLTKADVEHLRNGTSLSMNEAWRSAGASLGAKRGAHSSLRRFFLDLRRTGRGRPN